MMDLLDVFEWYINDTKFSQRENFWLFLNSFDSTNNHAFYRVLVIIKTKIKKFDTQNNTLNPHSNGCICAKYTKFKPMPVPFNVIQKCIFKNHMDYGNESVIDVKFFDYKQSSDAESPFQHKTHKRFTTNDNSIYESTKLFNERNRLTIFGLYLCLNSDKFSFHAIQKHLDIIDLYALNILRTFKNRSKYYNEPIDTIFSIRPRKILKFIPTKMATLSGTILYKGILVKIRYKNGRCDLLNDKGCKITFRALDIVHTIKKKIKDSLSFEAKCIIQNFESMRDRFETQIIVLDVLCNAKDKKMTTIEFIRTLHEHGLHMFKASQIVNIEDLFHTFKTDYTRFGRNIPYDGIMLQDGVAIKFPKPQIKFLKTGQIQYIYKYRYESEFSAYFHCRVSGRINEHHLQLYAYYRSKFIKIGRPFPYYQKREAFERIRIVKVQFNIDKTDGVLVIVNIDQAPNISCINLIHLSTLLEYGVGKNRI